MVLTMLPISEFGCRSELKAVRKLDSDVLLLPPSELTRLLKLVCKALRVESLVLLDELLLVLLDELLLVESLLLVLLVLLVLAEASWDIRLFRSDCS